VEEQQLQAREMARKKLLEDRKIKLLVLSDDNKVSEGGGWNIIPQFSNFFFLHIII
jgi:hypothetical protein